ETLPDKSLPRGGSGRSDNGNFHLAALRVEQEPDARPSGTRPIPVPIPIPIPIGQAQCDFHEPKHPIEDVLDGRAETHWETWPEQHKPHVALFAFVPPLGPDAGPQSRL